MSSSKVNKIKIEGDKNISVQDVYNSSVVINTADMGEVQKLIEELHDLYSVQGNNTLNIFVLTTTVDRIKELYSDFTEFEIPYKNYGNEPLDWVPFNNKASITELLTEYSQISGFKIEAYLIDNWMPDDDDILATLVDDIVPNTILVADSLSLDFTNNRDFAKLFDDSTIGGCLIPVCHNFSKTLQFYLLQRQRQVFRHLNTCFYRRFNREYIFIEPNVASKEELFRRFTNIATKHLGIRPIPKVSWRKRFIEGRSKNSITGLKSSI